ncbi:MAG: rhomboid family protein [Micavibrio sp.]|nr:rhomboid family protein [Micavibrio sp.]
MPDDNVIHFVPRPPGGDPEDRQPFIKLPGFTKYFALLLLGIHILLSAVSEPTRFWVFEHFGLTPAYYGGALPFDWPAIIGPLTFTFIHGNWTHLIMNTVMLVAFGAGLEPWMGWKRLAFLMFLCNCAAVILQVAFDPGSTNPVIGASGALSGLFAAAIIMLQDRSGAAMGKYGYWPMIVIWVGASIAFGVIGGPNGESIAWQAHIGGFLTGFALYKPVMKLWR